MEIPRWPGLFYTQVDIYAAEAGVFKFQECGNTVSPTIGLKRGVTYTFLQADATNWGHPLGFNYQPFPDDTFLSALAPSTSFSGSTCEDDDTCQSPMYFKDGVYLGVYDNTVTPVVGSSDYGVGTYIQEVRHCMTHDSKTPLHK